MTSSVDLTTFEYRQRLFLDIINEGPYGNSPLEVNADFLLENCFCDFGVDEWCRAVGVVYEINRDPIPEFRCRTTLIFSRALSSYETNAG